jgi:hypothetical protein
MAQHYPTYAEWFDGLSDADKNRTNELMAQFKAANSSGPEERVRSEISENIPQLALYLLLRDVWVHINDVVNEADMWLGDVLLPSTSPDLPLFTDATRAMEKMQEAGVSQADIVAIARLAAYNAAAGIVGSIDRGHAFESGDGAPGWKLMETNTEGNVTGRNLAGLYEDLLDEDGVAANEIQR